MPTLAALLIAKEKHVLKRPEDESGGVGVLQRVTDSVVRTVIRQPALFTGLGVLAVVLTGLAYGSLEPKYRLADQVPDREQALAGTASLDQKLTGANPIHVMISWPGGTETDGGVSKSGAASETQPQLFDARTLSVIADAHHVVEEKAGLGNVWSLDSLRRWLAEAGDDSVDTMKRYVSILPEHLVRRFISKDEHAVLVTARLPDIDASEILPVVDLLDEALQPLRDANPDFEIAVTGLPAIAARNSATLIQELNWGLVGDMFVIFIFLGLALRSTLAGVASVLPSLFPIFATGTLLWAAGEGLQFASIIAITVAFSLAIDSTIHFLNRFRLEEDRLGGHPGTHNEALMRDCPSHRACRGDDDHRAGAGARRDGAVGSAVAAVVRPVNGGLPVCLADRSARHSARLHRALPQLHSACHQIAFVTGVVYANRAMGLAPGAAATV